MHTHLSRVTRQLFLVAEVNQHLLGLVHIFLRPSDGHLRERSKVRSGHRESNAKNHH